MDNYNYLTRANYLYLFRCVRNYARLIRKKHVHNPGESVGAGICNLFYELDALVGEQISVNIHTEGKRLIFVLWDNYEWGHYNVYWIPVKFVESLPVPLKRLTISFLHLFGKSMKLLTTNRTDDMDFILEWQLESADEFDDPKDRQAYVKHIESYLLGGKVHKLMERVETKCYHRDLRGALDSYVPASDRQRKWIDVMKDGLRFIGEDRPDIFQYAYDVYADEENECECEPLTLEQTIRFIYDADDWVTRHLSQYVDEIYNSSYAVGTCATLTLAPDTNEPFGKEAFPEEFFEYMDKLNDFIRENNYA